MYDAAQLIASVVETKLSNVIKVGSNVGFYVFISVGSYLEFRLGG